MNISRKYIWMSLLTMCILSTAIGTFSAMRIEPYKESDSTEETSATITSTEKIVFDDNKKLRGTLFDRNGIPLSYTVYEENPQNYYREFNSDYSHCFSNIVDGLATEEGLDSVFEDTLRMNNPTKVNNDDSIGRSIQLTLDAELQQSIYNILNDVESGTVINGSSVIMRADGQLLSMVSLPVFDINMYRSDEEVRIRQIGTSSTENKAIKNTDVPYGVFSPILNGVYGTSDFKRIGVTNTNQILKNYIGFDVNRPISCDFGSITNIIEYDENTMNVSEIVSSPIYLAALTREFVMGDMVKPYVLLNEVDTNDYNSVIVPGNGNQVVASLTKEYASKVKLEIENSGEEFEIKLNDEQLFYGYRVEFEKGYYVCGMVLDDKEKDNSLVVVLQIINPRKELDFDGIDNLDDAEELFCKVLNASIAFLYG